MAKQKVLITVTTYPLPSRSYDELVCTAGVLEDGSWIRIYPVPLKFLKGLREDGHVESFKYNWIELDLKRRSDDFRPESHSPINYNFSDVQVHGKIGTDNNWYERKQFCLANPYTNLQTLIEASREPRYVSLATFKPAEIIGFEIEDDEREWKKEWRDQLNQLQLAFEPEQETKRELIPKLPHKFYYRFKDDAGKISRLMIEDWEIGALYWNCLRAADGNEQVALAKVREKYETEFLNNKDIYLFLGTTKEWHMRKAKNPFVIIGVFYPKKEIQGALF
ncbi:MAG TPA: hypothetical protein VGE24_04380 [Emticicia sp.]